MYIYIYTHGKTTTYIVQTFVFFLVQLPFFHQGLLGQMPTAQISPDVVNFSAAISALARGSQWQIALRVFSQMSTMQVMAQLGKD